MYLFAVRLIVAFARWSNRLARLHAYPTVEPWQAHPVAEAVGEDDRVHIACAYEDKGGKEAKQRCVGELEERAEHGEEQRGLRIGQAELVEVVDVGNAEVERGEEDDLLCGEACEDVKWDNQGAPDDLFADGALRWSVCVCRVLKEPLTHHDIVSVPNPATEGLEYVSAPRPVLELTVYYAVFEQRPSKQDGYEQYGFCRVDW